jgi:dTDP-4-amino-4,6-dideoxygalactose transaminase
MYANHGALKKHQHQIEGINSRLDGLQAAVLTTKLPYILNWTEKRIANATKYNNTLKGIEEIVLPQVRENSKHTFHLYVIQANRRDELMQYLKDKGIETSIHYPTALPNLPAYKYLNTTESSFPVATSMQSRILSLPLYPELTDEQIQYAADTIKEFYK